MEPSLNTRLAGSSVGQLLGYDGGAGVPVPYAPAPTLSSPNGMFNSVAAGNPVYVPTDNGGGGTTTAATGKTAAQIAADEAAAAEAADKAAKKANFDAQHKGINDSTSAAEETAGNDYKGSILDYLDTLKAEQRKIDNQGVEAELAKRQGMDSVTSYVSNGIRSGGVMLGNKNAGSSSAKEALARAYSELGGRQAAGVATQYGMDKNNIAEAQYNLGENVKTQQRHNEEGKVKSINNIVSAAAQQLSALDAQIAGASLPDRINLEAEKENIRAAARQALSQHDHLFDEGVAGTQASSGDDRIAKAAALATSGVGAANPYQLTTEAPAQFQGTGGFSSSLPLFQLPRSKRTT
jgi:hypothetical protein